MVRNILGLLFLVILGACVKGDTEVQPEFGHGTLRYSPDLSSISTDSVNVFANNVDAAQVTIILFDGTGTPVPGVIPVFAATDTNNRNTYPACAPTNDQGRAFCLLKSTKAEVKTLRLVSPIALSGNSVTFIPGPPDASQSTITSPANTVADNVALATVNITIRDAHGNPIEGFTPTFSATDTGGTNTYYPCTVGDVNGASTCQMTSTKAEVKTLSIQTPIISADGTATFIAGPAVPAFSNITGTGPIVNDGAHTSVISITLMDAFLNPLVGAVPTFTASGTGNTFSACGAADASGVSTCGFQSTVPELKTLSISSPIVDAGGTVLVRTDVAPVANNLNPGAFNEDSQSIVTLGYTDADGDLAISCNITAVVNVAVTQPCVCAAGVCTVGVTGLADYYGAASFGYQVTAFVSTSNTATANLTISPVDDAPVANIITPAAFDEDVESIINLSYTDVESDLATTCSISNLNNVTITQLCTCTLGACTVGVTSTANYYGVASFDYNVTANGLVSNNAAANLTVNSVDDAPVVANISPVPFAEDTQQVLTLSYTDVEGDLATTCTPSNLTNVSVTQLCTCAAGVCTVGVTGTLNYNGPASLDFLVTSNALNSNTATASLVITPVNDPPVASNITPPSFNEDTASLITLAYSDVEGHQAVSCSVSSLSNVTVSQLCNCAAGVCTVEVTGNANYYGVAGFDFEVTANGQTSNTASATLTIDPVDDAPVAANITPVSFNEDVQSLVTLSYSDIESDQAVLCSISNLSNVTVTSLCTCASGVCSVGVTGTADYYGAAGFDFDVTANGQASNTASATLTIDPVDDAPVAANITPVAFNEDTQSVITLSYTDTETDLATTCSLSSLTNVTESLPCACAAGVCTVGVTGTGDYNGAASFNYEVTANGQASNTASATLTITAVDDAPVAANITPASFNEDIQSIITLSYSDVESDLAGSCSITNLSNVTITQVCVCAAGVCTVGVTGTADYNGTAGFDFDVTANGQTSNVASAALVIDPVDDAPVAVAITPAAFNEDIQSVITLSYSDVDGDNATTCSLSSLSNVTVTQLCTCAAGVCTVGVTGTSNYNGPAGFDYNVTANSQVSNTVSATLSITAVDDAPVAVAITPAAFNEDTQSIITLSYTDVETDAAIGCSLSSLNNVTESLPCSCAAGICTVGVTGTADYFGAASFDFDVTANGQTSTTAIATLSITAVDDAPVATNITPAAFNEDIESIITLSYTDTESDLAATCSVSALSNVTETQICTCAAGVCTVGVTGTGDYFGAASFDFDVTANGQTSNTASATLTINAVDDAPVASAITPAAFNEDTQSIITLSYTDTESDQAATCSLSSLSNITETLGCACAAGVCTVGVTGTADYNGAAAFNYTVTANGQASNSASATLSITAIDDAPVAVAITPAAFNEDIQSVITLSYTDVESDQAVSCTISALSNVTVTQLCDCTAGVCTVGVTGTADFNGAASFDFDVTANGQTSAAATATLSITAVDDAPVATNLNPVAFNEDTQSIITLSYTDTETDQATLCSISALSNITETLACTCAAGVCTVGVTGTADYFGAASFDYTVTANGQSSNTASATLSITAVDDAPVAIDITPAAFNEDTQSVIMLVYSDAEGDAGATCSVSNLSNVTVTQLCTCALGVCSVGVTGTADYYGVANFDFDVTANGQTSAAATATLSITAVDDAPVAAAITPAAFNEDAQSIITLSYTDTENDAAGSCSISALSNVTVTQGCTCTLGVCTVGVTGTAEYSGAASFDFDVTANGQTSNSATATLSITAVDDAPIAAAITPAAFNEDTQSVITLSYSDVESDQAGTCSISALSNVTVTQGCTCTLGVCTIGVTGTAEYNGAASFDFDVTANGQTSNSATATLSITAIDDAPVAAAITPAAFNEDTQSVITLSYTDVESDQAGTCSLSALSNVTVTQGCTCASGVCTVGVTGTADYNGAASFDFDVTANGQTSNAATATLSITAVDDAPVAAAVTPAAFNEDTQSIITLSYTDTETDAAGSCSISALSNVTVTQGCTCTLGVCTVGVTGTANHNGAASFDFDVTANSQTSNTATATLSITAVDDAPVAVAITPAAFNEDTQSVITLSYTDLESDQAGSCSISALSNVTVTQGCTCNLGVCTVGVTGTGDYYGAASFDFDVTANGQTSAAATATLSITSVDDAPVAAAITPAAFNEDTQSVITLSYSDTESDQAGSCAISALSNVTVTQGCTCNLGICTVGVTGTPEYSGAGSFDFDVTANGQTSNSATATLSITAVDDAPVASDITPAAFNEDTQTIITLPYSDVESDQAGACSITALSNVTVTVGCTCTLGVCTVGVTGTADYSGAASLEFNVAANGQPSNTATATLSITAVDDAPVATAMTPAAFNEDTQSVITLSYTDVESDQAGSCSISALSNVTVTQGCTCASGICTVGVTGTADYSGAASFDFDVTANGQTSNTVTATLSITAVDDAPVAAAISPAAFNEDTQSVITLSYTDTETDAADSCSISTLSNVTVTQGCTCTLGVCTVGVTGTANHNGAASFNFDVTANGQTSNAAAATLSITAIDDAPVAAAMTPAAFNEDTQSVITLSYTDVESDQAGSCTISALSNVTVTQGCTCTLGVCTVGVTGTANHNGAASFDFDVTANGQTSNAATATLSITAIDDAPIAAAITPAAFNEDTQSVITLSYTDTETDAAGSCSISALSNVTVTQGCTCTLGVCTVGVTGTAEYNGAASFDFDVTANGQTSNSATATLSITAVDDAPVASAITPAAFNEDTQSVITLSYSDTETDAAGSCSISALSNVTVTQGCTCNLGVCTVGITGTADYSGAASFDFDVTANGQTSNAATATLSINAVDDAPVAAAMTPAAFNEDTQSVITLSYSDVESDQAGSCSISTLSNVTVTQGCTCTLGVCTVGVTGTADYSGVASFDFDVIANGQTSNTVTATLSITSVDDAPVAAAITPGAFNEDTQSVITLSYSDTETDAADSCSISSLSNVTVTQGCACTVGGVCTVGVTGTAEYNGAASFNYDITANGQTSNTVTATLSITAVDDAPVATAITPPSFEEDTPEVITLAYTDVESDQAISCSISALSNVTVSQGCTCASGVCTVEVTGTFNYNGPASFGFDVTANGQTSNVATASLTIDPVDTAPVTSNITPVAFNEDTQSMITLSYTDAESDQAATCAISALSNVTVSQGCTCTLGVCTVGITGTADYNGAGSFDFTVTANGQASNTASATLSITAVDDAPVAVNITPAAFNEDTQSIISLTYTDTEFDQAASCSLSNLSNVTVTQLCDCNLGVCTVGVTGTADYNGTGSFDFNVTANTQVSNNGTASLTISAIDDAPVAAAITPATFNEDTESIITLSYSDTESDQAGSCSISSLSNVTVTQGCTCTLGVCTVGVTGTAEYSGAASFDFDVTANGQTSNTVAATLSITAVDDAPVAAAITPAAFNEDTQSVITLSYTDTETDAAGSCSISSLSNVTVTQGCTCTLGVCTVGVTGTADYSGTASFDFDVTANGQTSNAASATLSITAVDDAPVAAAMTPAAFNEDTQSVITLSYSDVESDQAGFCSISAPSNVTVTQGCTCTLGVCTVGVTGTADYNGAASFDFDVTANGQTSAAATATLSITAVDDAPVAAAITPAAFNEDTQSVITLSYTDTETDAAGSCSISSLSNVTVTQGCTCTLGVCTVGVTGTANHNGAASFDFDVTANGQTSNAATATLSITAVDDAPVAAAMTPAAFNEDTQSVITLSYTDTETDAADSCSLSALSNVTVTQACTCTLAGVCTVGVTGTADHSGAASFDFDVTANGQTSATATATLSITAVDDAPVAAAITPAAFNEDTQSVITLSYSDVESDQAGSCSISALSNVTVTQGCTCNLGVCTVGVTGTAEYSGAASFDFDVTANGQTSNSATATLSITAVDDAPVAVAITPAAFNEDTQSVITLSYTDVETDLADSCSISSLSNVTVSQACSCTLGGVCTVGVTGTADHNGAASFDFDVTANGQTSAVATATLSITAVDDAPVAAAMTPAAFNEDTQSVITLSYTDTETDAADSCSISSLSNVTVTQACTCTLPGVCTVGVTGTADHNGAASFDFDVTANGQTSNAATATLSITAVDDAPVAAAITPAAFNEDTQSVITLSYTDTETDAADSCSISVLSNVTVTQGCSCTLAGVCTVGVTGTADHNGAASFDFDVTANGQTSNAATATLSITAVDDAPVAAAMTPAAFNEDTQSVITLSYTDTETDAADSCSLSALSNVTITQACSCTLAGVCTVGVTGTADHTGAASFDFDVTANGQTSADATATLSITAVDDAPVAAAMTPAAFNEDTESIITLSYTDTETDAADSCSISSLSNVTVTQGCTCTLAGVCTVGVTGTANYGGAASFDFDVTANGQTSNAATATLSITAVDDAPVAAAMTPAAFNEDTQSVITLSYTDTETDAADSCSLSALSNVTITQGCSCTLAGVCTVGVTGTADHNGAASFDFDVTANGQTSAVATATLSITAVDDAPVAAAMTPAAFNEDTESIITLSYSDTETDAADSCSLSALSNVTETQPCACTLAGVCTVGVTGTADHTGAASFDFDVTANGQTSAVATATLSITAVDDAPVAAAMTPAAFNEDTESIITLSYTDTETDAADSCTLSALSNVTETQPCACTLAGVCTVGVTGTANTNGAASFDFDVTANGQTSAAATATLSITAVDDAPVAAAMTPAAFNEDTQSIITLSYSDVESDLAGGCSLTNLSNVNISQACSCTLAGVCTVGVTGTADHTGAASFDFDVTANGQTSATATATLSITAVDDAPVAAAMTPAAFNEDTESIITLSYTDTETDAADSCSISALSNVTETQPCACTLAGVCTVGVTGTTNHNGAASFDFDVTANGQTSNTATATLSITAVDDAPVAAAMTPAAFNEDTESIITLTYTDTETDAADSCTLSALSNVTETQPCACTLAGVCTVGVTGTANHNGAASFDFDVTANGQTSAAATATLSITAVDDAPVAAAMTPAAFNEDTESIITLSYSDTETDAADSCTLSALSNVTETQPCACTLAGVCTVGVTGTADHTGAASFDFDVTANGQTSAAATATLSITAVDDAPVASAMTPAAFNEDTQSVITLSYTDTENDAADSCSISSLSNVTVTQGCSCTLAGVCTVGVTGTADHNGVASFNFDVTANGQTSNTVTATLSITAVDDAPVAAAMTPAAFNEDTQSVITLSYTDTENDAANACSLSALSNVTVTQACTCTLPGVCTVGVTGTADHTGAASFDFDVTANGQTSAVATATLSITAVDDAPVAAAMTPAAFNEDTQSVITLTYTDTENDAADSCSLSALSNVTVTQGCNCTLAGVCTVGVTGTSNTNGAASFDFDVTANGQTSNAATATLSITAVDDAPVAINITPAAFNEDTESLITLTYTDVEFDQADSCTISNATNVTVTQACSCLLGTCRVGVTGTADYYGTASFEFNVTSNVLTSANATASLTISNVDDAPVAANITPVAFNEDVESMITLSYTDTESESATSCAVSGLTNVTETDPCTCTGGLCTVGITGTANYNGAASFTYTVTANSAASNSASATLSITAVNDVPVISAIGAQSTNKNTPTGAIAFTISDVDSLMACNATNLAMTSSNTAIVANGSVAWSGTAPNCSAVITPVVGGVGTTTITFTVNDGAGGTAPSNFQLTVLGVSFVWTDAGGTTINFYDFGDPGTNTSYPVKIKNIGNMASGTITITPPGGPTFAVGPTDCTTLAAGASCNVDIQWKDVSGAGTKTGTYTATDTNGVSAGLNVQGIK